MAKREVALSTDEVQYHFGVGRMRLWEAVSEGRIDVMHHDGEPLYLVPDLVREFGPPRKPVGPAEGPDLYREDEIVAMIARERGMNEDEVRKELRRIQADDERQLKEHGQLEGEEP